MTRMRTPWLLVLSTALGLTAFALRPDVRAQEDDQPDANRESKMQCPMMTGLKDIQLFADGPAVLLSKAGELNLSEDQKQRLQEIQESARDQAREVLNGQQREKLQNVPEERLSLMQISMRHMKERMQDQQQEGRMCPMCMRMMRERMQEETDETENR